VIIGTAIGVLIMVAKRVKSALYQAPPLNLRMANVTEIRPLH